MPLDDVLSWIAPSRYFNFLPQLNHISPGIVVLHGDSLMATARIRGLPFELMSPAEKNAMRRSLHRVWVSHYEEGLTFYTHFVRHSVPPPALPDTFNAEFARGLVERHRNRCLQDLFENDWFLSWVMKPPAWFDGEFAGPIHAMERIWASLDSSLREYQPSRLGYRYGEDEDEVYTEIAEALRLMLYGEHLSIREPSPTEPLGYTIYSDRVEWNRGPDHFEIRSPGGVRYGRLFGFQLYMRRTRPGHLNALFSLPMPTVITQSYEYIGRPLAIMRSRMKRNVQLNVQRPQTQGAVVMPMMMPGYQGLPPEQADEDDLTTLSRSMRQVESGNEVSGYHNFTMAVYSRDDHWGRFQEDCARARRVLAETTASVALEDKSRKAIWFSQLPGTRWLRGRKGKMPAKHFARMANFAAQPQGGGKPRWGRHLMTLRTVADTLYEYNPHGGENGDNAMTGVYGPTGSGKTTFMGKALICYDPLIGPDGQVFIVDNGQGLELVCIVMNGAFQSFLPGEATGMAPHKAHPNTPATREYLFDLVKTCALTDDLGPIPAEDYERLGWSIKATMNLPIADREWGAIVAFLGEQSNPLGLGARLKRWCRGGDRGWVFDNRESYINFRARYSGFNIGRILSIPDVITPISHYLLYGMEQQMDGRRVVINLDEAQDTLAPPLLRTRSERFIRSARKDNVACYIGTQEIEYLLQEQYGTFGETLIQQTAQDIWFRNPSLNETVMRDRVHMPQGIIDTIKNMLPGSHQVVIRKTGAQSALINFDLSSIEDDLAFLSGTLNRVKFAKEIRERNPEGWQGEYRNRWREAKD